MAKVILSAALTAAARSIGGLTFSTGPYGAFCMAKHRPVNSESPSQLGIRGGFQTLTKRWANTLTSAQQAGWIALAAAHQVHDTLGQLITLTGVNFYVKLNGALKSAGQPTIDTAPATLSAGSPGTLTVTAQQSGPGILSVAVTTNPGANDVPIVWSMHPITIGRSAIKKSLAIIQVFPTATAGPYDVLASWNLKHGLLLTGQVIACAVQYTDATTGWQGTKSVASAIAT